MASRSLGTLVVDLIAKIGGFQAGMDQATRVAEDRAKKIDKAFRTVKNSLLATFGVSLTVGFVKNFVAESVRLVDQLGKVAKAAGVGAEELQRLRFAMGQVGGITEQQTDVALQRFNRTLGAAITGNAKAASAFAALGGSLTDATGKTLSTDRALSQTFERLAAIEDGAVRAARASKIFGDEIGPRLAAALAGGTAGLEEAKNQLAVVTSDYTVRQAEALGDAWERIATNAGNFAKSLAVAATYDTARAIGVDEAQFDRLSLRDRIADLQRRAPPIDLDAGGAAAWVKARDEQVRQLREELAKELRVNDITDNWGNPGGLLYDFEKFAGEFKKIAEPLARPKIDLDLLREDGLEMIEITAKALEPSQDVARSFNRLFETFQAEGRAEMVAQIESQLESVRQFAASRIELEEEAHAERLETLRRALELERITEDEFHELSIRAAEETQRRITDIQTREAANRSNAFTDAAGQILDQTLALTAQLAAHDKRAFQLHKTAAIASAILNTYVGVTKTLAMYPGPVGIALAAAHAAAGFMQVRAIRATEFGGGAGSVSLGSTSASIGSDAAPAGAIQPDALAERESQGVTHVHFHGDMNGWDRYTETKIMASIRAATRDRDVILIDRGSRQWSELVGAQ